MDRMKKKYIGAVLAAFGLGMLLAGLVPVWGMIAALVLAAVGIFLLTDREC